MTKTFSWIEAVADEDATGKLRTLYDRIRAPDGSIDNIMMIHSLRPHTMEGHMALYKHVLHNTRNTLPKWLLEATGVYVSILNNCEYCTEHHFKGLERLLNDTDKAARMRRAFENNRPEDAFEGRELAIMRYAYALTCDPVHMSSTTLNAMREQGMSDGEILEINQVVAYFAYANRTVIGLGVTTDGDTLGLSPNSSEGDDWHHR